MAIYLYDGIMCPALFLKGNPRRAAYFYDTPEGQKDSEWRVSNSLVFVPDDDGDSWTAVDGPTGAHMVLVAPDALDTAGLQAVNDRLEKAYNNKERIGAERLGGTTHGPGAADTGAGSDVFAKPGVDLTGDTQPLWKQLGFASKADWKAAGSPTE